MADSSQRLFFDIFARDRGAKKEFDQFSRSVDDAGDALDDMGDDARTLDKQIATTQKLIGQLGDEFDRTGNKELLGDLRKRRAELAMLQQIRKELDAFKGGGPAKQGLFGEMFDNVGETLKALPAQLKGAAIVSAVGIGAIMAPFLGAAVAGAIVGGVGGGGIAGGIALAAQDNRVRSEASKLGSSLLADLQRAGSPFVAPLLDQFDELDQIGQRFTSDLHDGFVQLAPLIKPLVEGLDGFQRNIGPGIAKTFQTARPVIRALANDLPRIGDAISDTLELVAGNSRESTLGMIGLLRATEGVIRAGGHFVGVLQWQFSWLVNFGNELHKVDKQLDKLAVFKPNLGFAGIFADQAAQMTESLDEANDATGDYNTTIAGLEGSMLDVANATDDAKTSMVEYADAIQDQFDPAANLVHRLQDVKGAQQDYSEAVEEHGRKSPEAREANLRLAEAILAASSAAAKAEGTFDNELSPALRQILSDGGMTEAQIRDIEKAFRDAKAKGDDFAKTYKAKALLEFYSYRADERNPSGRAHGGLGMAGQTYLVGERGPELVTFGANGTVIPTAQSMAMLSGASGGSAGPAVAAPTVINFPGFTGDPIADAILARFRQDIQAHGGNTEAVVVYFGGQPT